MSLLANNSTLARTHNHPRHRLRHDWINTRPSSLFALRIQEHQNNCSLPLADFRFRNRFGMGSDIHVWTQAVCNAMQEGLRIRTEMPWIYYAAKQCGDNQNASAMSCYFPKAELHCPRDYEELFDAVHSSERPKVYRARGKVTRSCEYILNAYNLSYADVRAAGVEFLFSSLSQLVVDEAERQLNQVFAHVEHIPSNLITVHIRWGDKVDEMTLVSIEEYVQAVHNILTARRILSDESVHIFLATEDPKAVSAFTQAAPSDWNIYVDQYFHDFLAFRSDEYNGNPRMAVELEGEPGLRALGSLLVAMEATDYVLTTQSNWSRLMNELRKTILEHQCRGCTRVIDLRKGEW
jgi:hypothetical protein